MIQARTVLERVHRYRWIEHRRNRDYPLDPKVTSFAVGVATRNMKLPPSENPASTIGKPANCCASVRTCAHHLGQPAGMEQLTIEVMSGALIV